ncbi:hypothetical protein [Teredinibacter sp. KSP-S5-2]|uniref:hypothetical protein n=1 Tax=Teredinibacter sp. KSP-S5-2 TaxID=3034506 RepID=UPI002934FA39|nr:hypothetical protein [Teredinibacter sp. KSP-S5-2]WNO11163.1 hypothetical protein P5V12_08255 [Teredinibacter sp. KSP-S5-2]
MEEAKKKAYRHLGLTGYTSINNMLSNTKVGIFNIYSDFHNKNIQASKDLSSWLEVLMHENVNDFEYMDEDAFWKVHSDLCEKYKDYRFESAKDLFDDCLDFASKNS